jgi:drug/metabolite transporter (DMT)-like permease
MKPLLYTAFALVCFALNSILCRLALRDAGIDAASFTAIRVASGALTLLMLARFSAGSDPKSGSWRSAALLFAYAGLFSAAYLTMTAATGALMLFGSVQVTMITAAVFGGERPRAAEWIGLAAALSGLVYLAVPSLESPPLAGTLMMIAAGAAWGFYTLSGKGVPDPLGATAGNFVRSLPFAAVGLAAFVGHQAFTVRGALLAAASGAVASGIGYAVWFAALRYHTATRAAVVQLSVPAIAALGGIAILGEAFSLRLFLASLMILGGIALTISARSFLRSSSSVR